jgi:hypothetical protein
MSFPQRHIKQNFTALPSPYPTFWLIVQHTGKDNTGYLQKIITNAEVLNYFEKRRGAWGSRLSIP